MAALRASSGSAPKADTPSTNSSMPNPENGNGLGAELRKRQRKRRRKKRKGGNKEAGNGAEPGPSLDKTAAAGVLQVPQKPVQPPGQPQPAPNQRQNAGVVQNVRPPCTFLRFNELPVEVQQRIFKMAYYSCQRCIKWIYTSRKVKEWIEALLYESFVLPGQYSPYSHNLSMERHESAFQAKPKVFFAKSVKRIYAHTDYNSCKSDLELGLLSVCDSLTVLECWSSPNSRLTDILTTKSWPKLKTLSLNVDLLPKNEHTFHLPLFQHVTHLELKSKDNQLPSWKSLQSLANLTHMRVDMLNQLAVDESTKAVDCVCAIANEARTCLPPNLEHLVILIPLGLLYHISIERERAEDEEQWKTLECIRIGTFDPRIILGSGGCWERWLEEEVDEEPEESDAIALREWMEIIPELEFPSWPIDEPFERETWEDVEVKNRQREEALASQTD